MPSRKIVRKWRFAEWEHLATRTKIGLFLDVRDGEFYAFVPEADNGTVFSASTAEALKDLLRREGGKLLELVWHKVIRVELERPNGTWNPCDPTTAGHRVSLSYERVETADGAHGKRVYREWERDTDSARFGPIVRTVNADHWRSVAGVCVELPYAPELWTSLGEVKRKIQLLNHNIRTLISQPDLSSALLLSAGFPRMLTTTPPPPTEG